MIKASILMFFNKRRLIFIKVCCVLGKKMQIFRLKHVSRRESEPFAPRRGAFWVQSERLRREEKGRESFTITTGIQIRCMTFTIPTRRGTKLFQRLGNIFQWLGNIFQCLGNIFQRLGNSFMTRGEKFVYPTKGNYVRGERDLCTQDEEIVNAGPACSYFAGLGQRKR